MTGGVQIVVTLTPAELQSARDVASLYDRMPVEEWARLAIKAMGRPGHRRLVEMELRAQWRDAQETLQSTSESTT